MDTKSSVAWRCAGRCAGPRASPSWIASAVFRSAKPTSLSGWAFLLSVGGLVMTVPCIEFLVFLLVPVLHLWPSLTTVKTRNNDTQLPGWRPTAEDPGPQKRRRTRTDVQQVSQATSGLGYYTAWPLDDGQPYPSASRELGPARQQSMANQRNEIPAVDFDILLLALGIAAIRSEKPNADKRQAGASHPCGRQPARCISSGSFFL